MVMHEVSDDRYESKEGWVMAREYGISPNGNSIAGRWVLRVNGEWLDMDQYSNDIAERHVLELQDKGFV